MRRLGLPFAIAVMAMAFGATASSASIVENSGPNELTGELTLAYGLHTPFFEKMLVCDNHWEGDVNSGGAVHLDDIAISSHSGETGNCLGANDCHEWTGQIVEDTNGPSEYEVNIDFCLTGTGGGIDGLTPVELHCDIGNTSVHCDDSTAYFDHPLAGPIPVGEVDGEVFIEEPLGLMHE